MLYMAFSFNDPIVQLGLFICAYIIVTGVCSYFGYSSDQYGIYMAFTAFILSVVMILPNPIQIGNNLNAAASVMATGSATAASFTAAPLTASSAAPLTATSASTSTSLLE